MGGLAHALFKKSMGEAPMLRSAMKSLLLCLVLTASFSVGVVPPDITVAADGSANFRTVQQAVESIPKENRERIIIFIKSGTYKEKVRIDAPFITLRGESRKDTRIEFPQLREDFDKNPDDLGAAVVNINGDDLVIENLTIANTASIVGPHSFAVYGKADRTVIVDCDVLSEGADTLSLWLGKSGRYYHARCHFRGAVDFVCPRGWCYIVDSSFYETKPTAALWHDGRYEKDMKFVLRNCTFDGVEGWYLARHHHDAQFYLLDCTFSQSMIDRAPYRVIYPLSGAAPTEQDIKRNEELNNTNQWGERAYFHNCRRESGDYPWHKDNLSTALGSPKPEEITAAWTFAEKWDPEDTTGPRIVEMSHAKRKITVRFSEPVTVKGAPRVLVGSNIAARYVSGSGGTELTFESPNDLPSQVKNLHERIELNRGQIIATQASAKTRHAQLTMN